MSRTVFISDEKIAFSYKHENHRLNGPAIIYSDGSREWWKNDKKHRLDGPATMDAHGYRAWWKNGKRHRDDGPAIIRPPNQNGYIIRPNDHKAWWVNGNHLFSNGMV